MPRRGSLLYDNCKKSTKVRGSLVALSPLWGIAILAVVTSTPVWAVNWTGNGADSLWSTKENWQNNTLPAANASLAFRVSNVGNKTVTLGGTVVVKVSAVGKRPKGGANVLTAGGKFAGANVTLAAGAPEWVKGVSVVDGEIVLDAKATGMIVIVR